MEYFTASIDQSFGNLNLETIVFHAIYCDSIFVLEIV